MNEPVERRRQEVTLLTHLILAWHREIGGGLAAHKMANSPDSLDHYRRLIDRFVDADLSDRSIQNEIAHQQLSGSFEWFYGEEIPPEILERWLRDYDFEFEAPRRLNEVARRILSLNEPVSDPAPHHESSGRTVVRFTDDRDLLEKARHIYHHLTDEEDVGIGGTNFLIACSIERHGTSERDRSLGQSGLANDEISLLDETVLGVLRSDPGARANDFLDHLRSGKLVFKAALGEPTVRDVPDKGSGG